VNDVSDDAEDEAMDVDGDDGDEAEDNEQSDDSEWHGIRKEIGILTESEFQTVMTKCLRAMGRSCLGNKYA